MLLLIGVPVNAQDTATPTGAPSFGTATAAPTATSGGISGGGTARFNFKGSQNTFAVTIGSWSSGVGFVSSAGDLTILGGYNTSGITRVEFLYTSTAASTDNEFFFQLQDGVGGVLYNGLSDIALCASTCMITLSPGGIDASTFTFGVLDAAGVFTLEGMNVYHDGESESYSTDGNGCPILTTEQKAKLDPSYFASCSRCFVDATPVRANQIPTQNLSVPTFDLTSTSPYSIPVIVSGTPYTTTPVVVAPGGSPTAAPTSTGAPTATPIYDQIIFDFTGSEDNGFVPSFDAASSPNQTYGVFDALGFRSVKIDSSGAGTINRQYLQALRSISLSGITAVGYKIYNPSGNAVIIETYFGGGGSNFRTYASDTLIEDFFIVSPAWNIYDIFLNVYSGTGAGSSDYFYVQQLILQTSDIVTPTPIPTSTPYPTGAPWMPTPDLGDNDCSVAVFRDDSPMVTLPETLTVYDYACYTVVPEVTLEIPGRGEVGIDGVQLCITWFEMPVVQVFGIALSMDWILVGVIAWLIRILLSF